MERLHFGSENRYNGLEASIHIARYSFVKAVCANKRVLDIACGEGYGSHLMSTWGAREVHGVDISAESVAAAQRLFPLPNLHFTQGDAASVTTLFGSQKFDLIVSLETIEHVAEPEQFLASIKSLLAPGGSIIISCPNDWWYFPTADTGNPFHLRKYRLSEFQKEAESVLGPASGWFLGGPLTGFCNLPMDAYGKAQANSDQMLMLESRDAVSAQMLPTEFEAGPRPENASYFIGVWSDSAQPDFLGQLGGAALLPLSMDAFRSGIFQGHWPDGSEESDRKLQEREREIADLRHQLDEQAQAQRHSMLQLKALQMELDICRAAVAAPRLSDEELRDLQVHAHRYRRLRSLVPQPLQRPILKLLRGIKGVLRG